MLSQSIGGGTGGEWRNVTVPADLSLALAMVMAQVSLESPCRLQPEWNSACVLKRGRLILLPRLCLPAPRLPLGSGSGG